MTTTTAMTMTTTSCRHIDVHSSYSFNSFTWLNIAHRTLAFYRRKKQCVRPACTGDTLLRWRIAIKHEWTCKPNRIRLDWIGLVTLTKHLPTFAALWAIKWTRWRAPCTIDEWYDCLIVGKSCESNHFATNCNKLFLSLVFYWPILCER